MEQIQTSAFPPTKRTAAPEGMTLEKLKQQFGNASTDDEVDLAVKGFVARHLRANAPVKELLECAKPATYTRLCVGIAEALSNIDPDTVGVESIGVEPWLDLLDCSHHDSFETTEAEGLRSTCIAQLAQSLRTDEDCASVARAYARNAGRAGVPGISDMIGHAGLVPHHSLPSFCVHLVTELRDAGVRDLQVWNAFLTSAHQALPPDCQLLLVPRVCEAVQALSAGRPDSKYMGNSLVDKLIDLVPDNTEVKEGLDALVRIGSAMDAGAIDVFRNTWELVSKAVTIVGPHEPSSYGTVARKLMQVRSIDIDNLGCALESKMNSNVRDRNAVAEAVKSVFKAIPHFYESSIPRQVHLLALIEEAKADAWLAVLSRAKDAPYEVRMNVICWAWEHLSKVGLAREPVWSDLLSATLADTEKPENRSSNSSEVLASLYMACHSSGNYAGWAKAFALAVSSDEFGVWFSLLDLIGRDGAALPQVVNLLLTHLDAHPDNKQFALANLFRHLAEGIRYFNPPLDFAPIAKAFALSNLPADNASWAVIVRHYVQNPILL